MEKEFQSTHNLPFEIAPWVTPDFERFRIGTCTGVYGFHGENYAILGIINDTKGNGHFQDVLDWFYNSCVKQKA